MVDTGEGEKLKNSCLDSSQVCEGQCLIFYWASKPVCICVLYVCMYVDILVSDLPAL